jgi:hypothetical protein
VATNQLISTMATPLMVYECTMVFEAIDPATGAAVTGVTITNPVVAGVNLSVVDEPGSGAPVGPYMYVPGPES